MNKPRKAFGKAAKLVKRRQPSINRVVSEPTSGGIIFRRGPDEKLQILLIQDAKNRWTIPKGHIEKGETPRETCEREMREETGLQEMKVMDWLGKIQFQYRREQSLVIIIQHIYMVQALGDTNDIKKEDWMNGIGWHNVEDAMDKIEYEDINTNILLAKKKIREKGL